MEGEVILWEMARDSNKYTEGLQMVTKIVYILCPYNDCFLSKHKLTWINNRHIWIVFKINTKFFRVPFSIPYKKFFIGHDMTECAVVYLSVILIGDQILFRFCTRAVDVSGDEINFIQISIKFK